jgi:hypothetical protein
MMLLHFFRLAIGFEIRAIAAMVFSMKNEATIETGAGDSCNKNKRDKFSECAHGRAHYQI